MCPTEMIEDFLETYSSYGFQHHNTLQPTPGLPDTPWLLRTDWSNHFFGRDLFDLANQTDHPGWQDENETKLLFTVVVDAAESYFNHASTVAQGSSHALRRWARSISATECSPAPFRFVQTLATFKRYARYWTRLLCYLCRSLLPNAASQGLLKLNLRQSTALNKVIFRAEECVHGYRSSTNKLQQSIHKLFLTLIEQNLPSSSFDSPLLHFVGCLGIDKQWGSFRQPGTFTPILAGFVYCIRIIAIYETYQIDRTSIDNQVLSTFRDFHRLYLTSNSEYPFGDIINLLGYGIKCCSDISNPIIQWSPDCDSVHYHGKQLEIQRVGTMIRELVNIAYSLGMKFFAWEKTDYTNIPLSTIHDELGNRQIGYSFLTDPQNSVILNPRRILHRLLSKSGTHTSLFASSNKSSSKAQRQLVVQEEFEKLLQVGEIFLEILLVLSHLACGQPPRGTELLSILVCNTATHQRHLFVINGELAIITNYNKSQSVVGKGTLILRTFPECLSRLWICYLAFTKPVLAFAENTLHHQLNSSSNADLVFSKSIAFHTLPIYRQTTPPTINNLLFHSRHRVWKTDKLSKLLSYYGLEFLSFESLSVSVYRHLAISIFRKRIRHAQLVEDMDQERASISIATRQAGHSRTTSRRYYAIEIAEFNLLDYETLNLFQQTSQAWHQHFGLDKHIPHELIPPAAINVRLNPPLGSKVPLRLPRKNYDQPRQNLPLQSQHDFPIDMRTSDSLICIKIVQPTGFHRNQYSIYH